MKVNIKVQQASLKIFIMNSLKGVGRVWSVGEFRLGCCGVEAQEGECGKL